MKATLTKYARWRAFRRHALARADALASQNSWLDRCLREMSSQNKALVDRLGICGCPDCPVHNRCLRVPACNLHTSHRYVIELATGTLPEPVAPMSGHLFELADLVRAAVRDDADTDTAVSVYCVGTP